LLTPYVVTVEIESVAYPGSAVYWRDS